MTRHVIPTFNIIGISIRTTNENGKSAKDLETLWTKFWGENILQQIPNRINEDIYAVYTEYESDFRGAYTAIVGASVSSLDQIPDGFTGIEIAQASYEKFVSRGKMPEAILKTWMEVWQNQELKRAYKADFTIHGKKYFDGDNAEVESFVSIKD